jgi:hypothetical protein
VPSIEIENYEPPEEAWGIVLGPFIRPEPESESESEQPEEDES